VLPLLRVERLARDSAATDSPASDADPFVAHEGLEGSDWRHCRSARQRRPRRLGSPALLVRS